MLPECTVCSTLILLLLWTTGTLSEEVCSVHSSKEVLMGSSFQVYCIFKKRCLSIYMYQDETCLTNIRWNSTVAILNIVNLTQPTTITCRCEKEPEPCGNDIIPGYPPEVPHNLSCVQEGELKQVNCTWKTGSNIRSSSCLWVQEDLCINCTSVAGHYGRCSALFPVSGKQTHFSVWVTASNSLGKANSAVHNFILNDIVRPIKPNIKKVDCSSRTCQIYLDKAQNIQLVEIRYREDHGYWNTISFNDTQSTTSWNITSLNPFSLYTTQVRLKFSPTKGLWSEWVETKHRTDEEAPKMPLDAWYFKESTPESKFVQIVFKELSKSKVSGNILLYEVKVVEQGRIISSTVIKPTTRTQNVSCFPCNVLITANNSKGQSPARLIQLQPIAFLAEKVSYMRLDNHSVALSWPMSSSTDGVEEFLLEWHPTERKHLLQWIRVESHHHAANITGLQPAECYDGAVVYLHPSGTRKAVFRAISAWQMVPQEGPRSTIVTKSESVEVKWSEIPPEKRGGCLIQYTIYLEDSKGQKKNYSVQHPQREYTISGLILGEKYRLWVSAWTEAGQGPKGSELHFKPSHPGDLTEEKPTILVVSVGGAVFLVCFFLLCTCQFSSVQRRLTSCCHCIIPSIVPDPANSKWAKECASEKGEMKLHLNLSDSSMSEEEPDTIEVQELPQEKLQLQAETLATKAMLQSDHRDSQDLHVSVTAYQYNITSTYLKSFSHESSSSAATQASRSTDITVDYISTHGVMGEDDCDDDDDYDEEKVFSFFACPQSPFLQPLISIEGKLTLDSVKIDCSDFLDCL